MKKTEERDGLISKKLGELEERKSELQKKLESLGKSYKTNLKVTSDSGGVYNLRVITNIQEIVGVFSLIAAKFDWMKKSAMELGVEIPDSDYVISGYCYKDWKEDFKCYIEKLKTQEELKKIEKAISELPKFYTDDKRDEDEFEKILGEI